MDVYEKVVDLAARRGFFWQSYEIYGGVAGFYDLGPLGVLLKKNIIEKWREFFVRRHQEYVVEIETPVIAPAKVFEASGHVESFTDPIVECTKCHRKFRADKLVEQATGENVEGLSPEEITRIIREKDLRCPECKGELGEVKLFNLLFRTTIGPYEGNVGYLRPEAAQGMFVSFKRVYECMRRRIPLGIAQIGRVARNEISPRQGMIRLREFTIMEIEFFFDPEEPECPLLDKVADSKLRIITAESKLRGDKEPIEVSVEEAVREGIIKTPWLAYWMTVARDFVASLGVPLENQVFEEKLPHERAHYATQTFDQLVKVSRWGWVEVSGHAYRGDYDLSRHMKFSGQDLRVFKQYKEPIVRKVKKVQPIMPVLGRLFKSKAPEIAKKLALLKPEEVEKQLSENGYVELDGLRIPGEALRIVELEEKITGKHFIPHVAEPSFGAERLVYITLEYAYSEKEDRVVLKLPRDIAPIQVAVYPLVSKDPLRKIAREVYEKLVEAGFHAWYDESDSIGRRYARADEVGVPVCVTIDYQSLEDGKATLRDRDTWKQVRVPLDRVVDAVRRFVYEGARIEELGEPF